MTGAPIIEVKDLTRRFGALTAVDRLNLEVAPGEIFGLVGPDGAGKTTTLRLMCGLMAPDQGQVLIAGRDAPARRMSSGTTSDTWRSVSDCIRI